MTRLISETFTISQQLCQLRAQRGASVLATPILIAYKRSTATIALCNRVIAVTVNGVALDKRMAASLDQNAILTVFKDLVLLHNATPVLQDENTLKQE